MRSGCRASCPVLAALGLLTGRLASRPSGAGRRLLPGQFPSFALRNPELFASGRRPLAGPPRCRAGGAPWALAGLPSASLLPRGEGGPCGLSSSLRAGVGLRPWPLPGGATRGRRTGGSHGGKGRPVRLRSRAEGPTVVGDLWWLALAHTAGSPSVPAVGPGGAVRPVGSGLRSCVVTGHCPRHCRPPPAAPTHCSRASASGREEGPAPLRQPPFVCCGGGTIRPWAPAHW